MTKKTLQNVASEIPSAQTTRIENDKYVINVEPRMSAPKLAEYIVAGPARKETILKNAKKAPKAITLQYTRVRHALADCLLAGGLSADVLRARAVAARVEAKAADRPEQTWERSDCLRSSDALIHLATIAPQIVLENAKQIPRPQFGWGRLDIEGVQVSVQPELVFSIDHRTIKKVGAIILNTAKTDSLRLNRYAGKLCIADYLTVLVYRMLETRLKNVGVPLHKKCYAIDVFRDKVYTAPTSHKTLFKDVEAACRTIAALWDKIPVELDSEEVAEESDLIVGSE